MGNFRVEGICWSREQGKNLSAVNVRVLRRCHNSCGESLHHRSIVMTLHSAFFILPAILFLFGRVWPQTPVGSGDPASAILAFEQQLKAEPLNEPACLHLAAAYEDVYNYDQARTTLKQCSSRHIKSGAALVQLGDLDLKLQRYDEAITEFRQALRRSPSLPTAHLELGVAYQSKEDSDHALSEFNAALRSDPKLASAYYFRAEIYNDRQDIVSAERDVRQAL